MVLAGVGFYQPQTGTRVAFGGIEVSVVEPATIVSVVEQSTTVVAVVAPDSVIVETD